MKKKVITALIVVAGLVALALLMHLTVNNLIPFISNLHKSGAQAY